MLHLVGVHKVFHAPRQVSVLDDVHLAVAGGRVCVLSGAVGSGKTTLLRLAAGELSADRGEVFVLGRDLARLRSRSLRALRRHIAWVPQELVLLGDRSARGNVSLAAEIAGLSARKARAAADEALDAFGLIEEADVPTSFLSTGQRRRVALARGLVVTPKLLLVDEPTGDLDRAGVSMLVDRLVRAAASGAAVVATTHDRRLLEACQSRDWMQFRLACGALHDESIPEERDDAVIVPFPQIVRAGGSE